MGLIHVNEPDRSEQNESANAAHYYNQNYVTVSYGATGPVQLTATSYGGNDIPLGAHDGASYNFWAHSPEGTFGGSSLSTRQAQAGFSGGISTAPRNSGYLEGYPKIVKGRSHVTPTGVPYVWDSGDVTTGISTINWRIDSNHASGRKTAVQVSTFGSKSTGHFPQEYVGFSLDMVGSTIMAGAPGWDCNRVVLGLTQAFYFQSFQAGTTLTSRAVAVGSTVNWYQFDNSNATSINGYSWTSRNWWYGNEAHPAWDAVWHKENQWANFGAAYKITPIHWNGVNPERPGGLNNVDLFNYRVTTMSFGTPSESISPRRVKKESLYKNDEQMVGGSTDYEDQHQMYWPHNYGHVGQPVKHDTNNAMSHVRFGHSISYSAGLYVGGAPGNFPGTSPGTAYTAVRDEFGGFYDTAAIAAAGFTQTSTHFPWDGYGRVQVAKREESLCTNKDDNEAFHMARGTSINFTSGFSGDPSASNWENAAIWNRNRPQQAYWYHPDTSGTHRWRGIYQDWLQFITPKQHRLDELSYITANGGTPTNDPSLFGDSTGFWFYAANKGVTGNENTTSTNYWFNNERTGKGINGTGIGATNSLVGEQQYDKFGWSVKTRYRKILVGAPDYNSGRGKAYLYDEELNLIKSFEPNPGTAKSFGYSVDMGSGRIAIGHPGGNDGKGECYIYDLDGCHVGIVSAWDGQTGDNFGHCVSIKSGIVAVGAPDATVGIGSTSVQCGAVYGFNRDRVSKMHQTPIFGLFDTDGEPYNPARIFKITPTDGDNNDRFGHKVHVASGRVFVGAPQKHNPELHPSTDDNRYYDGAAYVYNLGGGFLQKVVGNHKNSHFGWEIACDTHYVCISEPFIRNEDLWTHPSVSVNAEADIYNTVTLSAVNSGVGVTIPQLMSAGSFEGIGTKNFSLTAFSAGAEPKMIAFTAEGDHHSPTASDLNPSQSNPWIAPNTGFSTNTYSSGEYPADTIHLYYTPSVITFCDAIDQKYQ